MNLYHNKIESCKFVIQFEGSINQLVLVKADKTQTAEGIKDNRLGAKPKYWLLWGPLGTKIEDLGATCLIKQNGNTYSETQAHKTFIEASQFVDRLTMKKIIKK